MTVWRSSARALQRMGRSFALAALFSGAAPGVQAQAAAPLPPIPVERFFQYPSTRDATLSPSGRKLALTTSVNGGHAALAVIDLDAGGKVTVAAKLSDADVIDFHWVGDERLVFSVVDLQEGSGRDRREAPGLFAVNADGGRLHQLVNRRGKQFVVDAMSRSQALDWNHELLAVPLPQEGVAADEVVIGEETYGRDWSLESVMPKWLNVRTGLTRSFALTAPAHVVEWLFDSKGQPRVAVTSHEGQRAIHWRAPGQDGWQRLAEGSELAMPFEPVAVDDAGNLYVSFNEGPDELAVLSRFDFTTRKPKQPALVTAPGFDVRAEVVLDRVGARALGVRLDTDGEQTVWYDPALQRMQALADERLPGRVNRLSCRRCGADDMVVLVYSYADRDPGRYYVYQAADKRWSAIATVQEGIDPRRMAAVDLQRIKARDGRDLPVWLTLPPGLPAGQPAPAVVLVHGGPWVRGGHWRWDPMAQFLASRGYLVINPEFRGSTGYGQAHREAGWKQWGQAMQDDIADALLWARAQGLADPRRACIAGASYGGYATLMGLVRHPDLYRCGVAWVAVTDPFLFLQGEWGVDDDLSDLSRSLALPLWVGDPVKDAAMLTAVSPLAQARRIQAPLLLAAGESDLRVPIVHGERLRDALRAAGHPPEWVSYANEAHSWRQVSTRVDFAQRVERFLARHLSDEVR